MKHGQHILVTDATGAGSMRSVLRTMTLERYRCFVAPATIELRPLTVLFGKNSAGKSTLLRALPIIAASCGPSSANRTGPLALEHPAAMGLRYGDLRTYLVARNDIGLKLSWDIQGGDEIEIGLRDMTDLGPSRQVVSRLTIRDGTTQYRFRTELDAEARHLVSDGVDPIALDLNGISPKSAVSLPSTMGEAVAHCERLMLDLFHAVDWLGPIRLQPPRARVQRIEKALLGPFGEGLTEVLAQPDSTALLRLVSDATETTFGSSLEIAEEAGEISLAMRSGVHRTHVLDVGAGVAQVLPVLVRLAEIELGRANGRIVAIEQPEAHLHTDAEVALANIIVRSVVAQHAAANRPRVVLETHSENLLLSLQLAVLEKRLAPDDVLLYWFDQLDDGSVVPRPIRIDADGRPDPQLPPGAFSENLEIAREILRARSKRS